MSVRTQSALLAIFALTVPCTVWADDKPDVLEIIQKADAATKAVQDVSYRAEFWAEGEWASKMPRVTGEVFAHRPARSKLWPFSMGYDAPPFRLRGTATALAGGPTVRFDCAVCGKKVFVLDHDRRTCLFGKMPVANIPYSPAAQLRMIEYVHPTPFSDELESKVARHEGVKDVGGVSCDVIYVLYRNGSESRWYFGQEDHLPRGVERLSPKGKTVLLLSEVNTEPDITEETFEPQCPEGYTEHQRILKHREPEDLKEYVGIYRINDTEVREVMYKKDRLYTQRTGNPPLQILWAGNDTFYYPDSFVSLRFYRDDDGKITRQVLDRLYGDEETAVRTECVSTP
jgi:outer membrane lipoprotein-sorting protein